jgi:hypothetical protein
MLFLSRNDTHIERSQLDMRRFGLAAFLAITLLVGVVGAVAYNLGISAGAAEAAISEGASVIYAPASFSPLGLLIGGFFLILLVGFVARAFVGPRRAMHAGGWGPGRWSHAEGHHRGSWDHESVPPPFQPMLERWHREAHTEEQRAGDPGAGTRQPPEPSSKEHA